MKAIKDAIYSTMANDDTLVALATGGISYSHPEGTDVDFSAPRVTYFMSDGSGRDDQSTLADETYQIDVWSLDPDVNDSIAGRIDALFANQPLSAFHRRVDAVRKIGESELYEDDLRVHHKVLILRVLSYPTE